MAQQSPLSAETQQEQLLAQLNLGLAPIDSHKPIGPKECPTGFALCLIGPLVLTFPVGFVLYIGPCFYYTSHLYYCACILYTSSVVWAYVNNLLVLANRTFCTREMRAFHVLHIHLLFAALGDAAIFFVLFTKYGELWFALLGLACYFVSLSEYFPAFRQQHSIAHCQAKGTCMDAGNFSLVDPRLRPPNAKALRDTYSALGILYIVSGFLWMTFIMLYIQELVSDQISQGANRRFNYIAFAQTAYGNAYECGDVNHLV